MSETEEQAISRLRGRTLSKERREGHCRAGGVNVDKIHGKLHRAKITRRGGQMVVLKYGIEYMRELGRKGGLVSQAQIREATDGEKSKG